MKIENLITKGDIQRQVYLNENWLEELEEIIQYNEDQDLETITKLSDFGNNWYLCGGKANVVLGREFDAIEENQHLNFSGLVRCDIYAYNTTVTLHNYNNENIRHWEEQECHILNDNADIIVKYCYFENGWKIGIELLENDTHELSTQEEIDNYYITHDKSYFQYIVDEQYIEIDEDSTVEYYKNKFGI